VDRRPREAHRLPRRHRALSGTIHTESVVPDGNGGFTTKLTQTGTVDEVTLTNVVVRSSDGYTQIYTFPSAAASSSRSVAVQRHRHGRSNS
jgi:hypothetical protein